MAAAAQVGLGHITAGHLCQPGAAAQPHLGKDRRLVSPRPYLITEPRPSEFHQYLTATCMLIKFVEKGNLFSCLEDRVLLCRAGTEYSSSQSWSRFAALAWHKQAPCQVASLLFP